MAGKLDDLATFFVEPDPAPSFLDVVILHFQTDDGADTGESVSHKSDQCAIAASY